VANKPRIPGNSAAKLFISNSSTPACGKCYQIPGINLYGVFLQYVAYPGKFRERNFSSSINRKITARKTGIKNVRV
jgi:hypothetical protein